MLNVRKSPGTEVSWVLGEEKLAVTMFTYFETGVCDILFELGSLGRTRSQRRRWESLATAVDLLVFGVIRDVDEFWGCLRGKVWRFPTVTRRSIIRDALAEMAVGRRRRLATVEGARLLHEQHQERRRRGTRRRTRSQRLGEARAAAAYRRIYRQREEAGAALSVAVSIPPESSTDATCTTGGPTTWGSSPFETDAEGLMEPMYLEDGTPSVSLSEFSWLSSALGASFDANPQASIYGQPVARRVDVGASSEDLMDPASSWMSFGGGEFYI